MRRRRRLRPSLSLRITASFGLGALAVAAAVAVSSYWFAARFLARQQEASALHQAYLNAVIVRARLRAPHPDLPSILDALTTGPGTQTVIYATGRWFSSSLLVSRDGLPTNARSATLNGSVVRAWARIAGDAQLVVGVPLPEVDADYFQVVDQSSLARTLAVLRSVLLGAAAATAAAGAALGWWVSRRLTAPLRSVAAAAQRLARGNFETQLPPERDLELAGLVDSFNTMVVALRHRIERDARFAADVSHELRSPLTTLSTSLSVLRNRRDELSPRSREALALVSLELVRFERLVDDLLEISRSDVQADLVDAEPLRICQLILNLLERAEYTTVTAEFDNEALDAVVQGDKRRLEQVIRNLLDNASAYAGGAAMITAEATATTVSVYVDDDGPGVPAEERERIFDRFTRGRGAARRGSRAGTGLGLALVREHVRLHRGKVWVTDAPSGGARFSIELPRVAR